MKTAFAVAVRNLELSRRFWELRPMNPFSRVPLGLLILTAGFLAPLSAQEGLGYEDTPIIPGTPWHVHDGNRPQPPVVTPGANFSLLAPPPSDAVVLFDGHDLSQWEAATPAIDPKTRKPFPGAVAGGPPRWKVSDGILEVVPFAGDIRTKRRFADFQLHLEFAEPTVITGKGQYRGNSGVLFNGMYEVQILDSYQVPTYPDGQAGALYGQTPPLVNACKPPGEWQTYDIIFESPRWDSAGVLVKKAAVTVIQNGVVVQNRREYFGSTDGINGLPHKALGAYLKPHPPEVVLELQEHRNPVRFRNIWIRTLGAYDRE
jgi:hypothetical protein